MTTTKPTPSPANGGGPPVAPPGLPPHTPASAGPEADAWVHVSGPVRKKAFTVYKQRSEEPPGWLMVVDSRVVFVHDAPHAMIAAVLAEVVQLVKAAPAAGGASSGPRSPAPPPPPPRTPGQQPAAQQTFPGERAWPGDQTHLPVGIPPYLGDPAMKSKFGAAVAARLSRRPATLNGWAEIRKVIGPSPPHRPGLWELFPGMGGAPHAHPGRMEQAAIELFTDMGYTVENGHVWIGKAGASR